MFDNGLKRSELMGAIKGIFDGGGRGSFVESASIQCFYYIFFTIKCGKIAYIAIGINIVSYILIWPIED